MTAVERSYAERYREWIARARPLLDARQWKEAFTGYPYVVNDTAPFTPLPRPLAACVIAPVTSGGLYLPASQEPFDEPNPEGDRSRTVTTTPPTRWPTTTASTRSTGCANWRTTV